MLSIQTHTWTYTPSLSPAFSPALSSFSRFSFRLVRRFPYPSRFNQGLSIQVLGSHFLRYSYLSLLSFLRLFLVSTQVLSRNLTPRDRPARPYTYLLLLPSSISVSSFLFFFLRLVR